jgi:hypothetical protein
MMATKRRASKQIKPPTFPFATKFKGLPPGRTKVTIYKPDNSIGRKEGDVVFAKSEDGEVYVVSGFRDLTHMITKDRARYAKIIGVKVAEIERAVKALHEHTMEELSASEWEHILRMANARGYKLIKQ